jgi:hypothetical protein
LRLVRQSIKPSTKSAISPPTTPTAIPAFAPVDNPLLLEDALFEIVDALVGLAIIEFNDAIVLEGVSLDSDALLVVRSNLCVFAVMSGTDVIYIGPPLKPLEFASS